MTKTRGVLFGIGLLFFVLIVFFLGSIIMNNVNLPSPQRESITNSETVTNGGERVYVSEQAVNTPNVGHRETIASFLDSHIARGKVSSFMQLLVASIIIATIIGKLFTGLYSHKRKSYEVMKDDLRTTEEMAIKYEALVSRASSPEQKAKYERLLSRANDRQILLMEQVMKSDSKFAR